MAEAADGACSFSMALRVSTTIRVVGKHNALSDASISHARVMRSDPTMRWHLPQRPPDVFEAAKTVHRLYPSGVRIMHLGQRIHGR